VRLYVCDFLTKTRRPAAPGICGSSHGGSAIMISFSFFSVAQGVFYPQQGGYQQDNGSYGGGQGKKKIKVCVCVCIHVACSDAYSICIEGVSQIFVCLMCKLAPFRAFASASDCDHTRLFTVHVLCKQGRLCRCRMETF